VTRTLHHFQRSKGHQAANWLVVLAGQHGHTVMVTYPYAYMTYIVSPLAGLHGRQSCQWRRQELKFGRGGCAPFLPFPRLPPFPFLSQTLSCPSHFPFALPSSIPSLSLPYPRLPVPSHPPPFPFPLPAAKRPP